MTKRIAQRHNRGMVMLTIVLFFLFLSTTVVLGIANPILKQVNTAQENLRSKGSYYAVESSLEDIFYRLQSGKDIAPSEVLDLNGGQVTITTTDVLGGKQVVAVGDVNNVIRKIQSTFTRGTGVVFRYGTQSGQGGVIFENNSSLMGSLYSNGNIIGDNGAYITGDAFVAVPNGSITNMRVGYGGTGVANAHTVTGSTVTGALYCQVGSGNNKPCNTTWVPPEPVDMPIKEDEIAQWQADALAGGTQTGNVTISSPTSLGPKKIVGNLTIGSTLTLTNTLWVTGNIVITGGVKLDPSFGASSGVIVADGYIDIKNGVVFQDSGTAGSYILFLSNSACDVSISASPCFGNDAITVGNNSDISIANAQQGTVYFSNNANVKEAAGNKLRLKNNSQITYGSGIIYTNFTSGPSGGYNVADWGEIQ